MHYVYVLQSLKDFKLYTGYTSNLEARLQKHNEGAVRSTQNRIPFKVIYYEACLSQEDALHREKYLKTTYGKRYIRHRLGHYFSDLKM